MEFQFYYPGYSPLVPLLWGFAAPDVAKGSLVCHIRFGGSILPTVSEAEAGEACNYGGKERNAALMASLCTESHSF